MGRRRGQPEPFGAALDERPHDIGALAWAEMVARAWGLGQTGLGAELGPELGPELSPELSNDRIGHELGESIQIPRHSLR